MPNFLMKYLTFSLMLFLPSTAFASLGVIAEVSLPGPYAARYNPVNKLTYISYRDGIAVFNGTEMISSIPLKGEVVAVNSKNGYVYVIQDKGPIDPEALGFLYLIQGTEVIKGVGYVGKFPSLFAVNPETGYFYVSHRSYPSFWFLLSPNMRFLQTVKDDKLSVKVPVGRGAHLSMRVEPNTGYLYVANSDGHSVSIIQETTNIGAIKLQGLPSPEAMAVNPNNGRVYVTAGSQIAIIEGQELVAMTPPDTDAYYSIAVEPNSGYIYAVTGVKKLSVFDGIDLLGYVEFPHTITILKNDPKSGLVYTVMYDTLEVIQGLDLIAEIPVGPVGDLTVDPDRGFVYVTNQTQYNKVTIVGELE